MEKVKNDDYPSFANEYYDRLICNQELLEIKIIEMDENEIINFYDYVQEALLFIDNMEHRIWFVKSYLESLDVIKKYLKNQSCKLELTEEEERTIEETIRVLEARRHPNPIKRLIKYFKG